jgi:ferredoxin-NADP reductase
MEKFQWQIAQVKNIVQETHLVKTFTLLLPQWQRHLPGQHYDIRLTAEDGYQAQRSYSIASSPDETNPTALLFSVRSAEEAIYRNELEQMTQRSNGPRVNFTFTRQPPAGWTGYQRRIDKAMLEDLISYFATPPQCFVCGPSGLVEQVATTLVDLGIAENTIRTERFGPT